MNIINKLKSSRGVSLSEMLLAMLILSLTISFISGGVMVIKHAYDTITLRAEARTLLSTTILSVTSELQQGANVAEETVDGTRRLSFYSYKHGCRVFLENKESNIYMITVAGQQELPLLTNKTITKGFVPMVEDITYDNQVFSYTLAIYYRGEVYETQQIYVRPIHADRQ